MSNVKEFPMLKAGDVLILSPDGKTWKLPNQLLRNSSSQFATLLDKTTPYRPHASKRQKTEGTAIEWKFKMIPEDGELRYVQFEAVSMEFKQPFEIPINVNGVEKPRYIKTYDNYFRCMVALQPQFNTTTPSTIVTDCVSLLNAAEHLGSAGVVRNPIENQLLRISGAVWKFVASKPGIWADLAARLESPTIFQEAMAHVIGAYNLENGLVKKEEILKLSYGGKILDLAKKKIEELEIDKKHIERELIGFCPRGLTRNMDNGAVPGRASYASDIYYWQALSNVRQYVTEAILDNSNFRASDGGFSLYKKIATGGDCYLAEDSLAEFHRMYPMTRKGELCFEKALRYVKDEMKPVVESLMVTQIQGPTAALDYLLNAKIEDDEMPWIDAEERSEVSTEAKSEDLKV